MGGTIREHSSSRSVRSGAPAVSQGWRMVKGRYWEHQGYGLTPARGRLRRGGHLSVVVAAARAGTSGLRFRVFTVFRGHSHLSLEDGCERQFAATVQRGVGRGLGQTLPFSQRSARSGFPSVSDSGGSQMADRPHERDQCHSLTLSRGGCRARRFSFEPPVPLG